MKRLKNIESKNEQQLEAIKDEGEKQLDPIKDYCAKKKTEFPDEKNQSIIELINKIKKASKKVDYKKLLCVHSNVILYYFNGFTKTEDLGNNIY